MEKSPFQSVISQFQYFGNPYLNPSGFIEHEMKGGAFGFQ